ncbi:MAG TPA: cation diffusion facilitator family transporter [Thermomicrobiales bacterium]|jgi:cobalt-zinc-cadmium efflux system protein
MTDHRDHRPPSRDRAFALGIALNLAYVAAEATFGVLSHSLALVADAGHNLSDVLGLALAWGAAWLSRRRPTPRRSYGLRRSSVFAALLNAVMLLIAVGAIAFEAIRRLLQPGEVAGTTMIWVAAVGVAVNAGTALLFASGRKGDLNIRGAFLHMAADAAVSCGVVVAGLVILATGWAWVDPVVSLVIAAVIVVGTWDLLRESVDLALDAVPEGIDPAQVKAHLVGLPNVAEVHDLHIWGMSTTETALTAHLVIPDAPADDALLARACRDLHDRFGIAHATLQVERGDPAHPCRLAQSQAV